MDTCEVRIFPDLKLGVGWLHGSVTGQIYLDCIRSLHADNLWQPGYATVWILADASEVVFLPDDVDEIVTTWDALRERRGQGKLAFVVDRPVVHDLFFLLALKDRASNRPSALFWSTEDALKWVGVADGSLQSVTSR